MRDMLSQVNNALEVPIPKRSRHNLSSQTLTTMPIGKLVPVFAMETVPGGKYTLSAESLLRFMPLVSPVMHKMTYKVHYFYVPNRILWRNWPEFLMGKKDKITNLDPAFPIFKSSALNNLSNSQFRVHDYFNYHRIPVVNGTVNEDFPLNPFKIAAYKAIYEWWYRHKGVSEMEDYQLPDGELTIAKLQSYSRLYNITYEDDYFLSALPTPQLGQPIVFDHDARVYTTDSDLFGTLGNSASVYNEIPNLNDQLKWAQTDEALFARVQMNIEELRRANQLQKFMELSNHTRTYKEWVKANYGATVPDGTLQMPEFITGFNQPVVVSDVINQADNFQGRMSGTAATYGTTAGTDYYTSEHGLIIGIAAVTYKPVYNEAQPRINLKTNRFDFFMPAFDTLGEQALWQGEIDPTNGVDDYKSTWGYVPRHFEYRSSFDQVTGQMKTLYMHWHLGMNIMARDGVAPSFFNVVDERRIFAFQDPNADPIVCQIYNYVSASLPMGDVATPTL